MLIEVNRFLMIISIAIGIFMLTRYVFLEPAMEEKKQRIFYLVSFLLIIFAYFVVDENLAMVLCVALGALNIFLGRKKHRLLGICLILPITGMMDGAASIIIFAQIPFFGYDYVQVFVFLMYVFTAGFLLWFLLRGKAWRKWFAENMKNRRPLVSEYVVTWVSGIFLLVVNNVEASISDPDALPPDSRRSVITMLVLCTAFSFLLTVIVVVLIMQGNRRTFYHDRVSNLQFHMIATMADIVENRDSNTGGHIRRTAKYVEIIGKNLKKKNAFPEVLTDQYLADMVVAAPLHDIGKISIPDAILNKPGRLTEEEFAIMKTHAVAGRDALKKAESELGEFGYLEVAQKMAEFHHEWWNGKGYPHGEQGEEIPLCARIMAVADVFDALTSKRCYKAAMPVEKAYAIIQEESGTHFDPLIAETLLNAREEIEQAMREIAPDEDF